MTRDIHGTKRGRNDPCWCGSGLKYKRCHLDRANQAHPRLADVVAKVNEPAYQSCSCPTTWKIDCTGKIVRAHSLSRKQAFGAIAENGHVFSLTPHSGRLFHKNDASGRLIGVKQASTFTGFCGRHDQEIFRELDTEEFDGTARTTFLSSYRTLCRELFAKVGQIQALEYGKNLDKGRSEAAQLAVQTFMSGASLGARAALKELESLKSLFDYALIKNDFGSFDYRNFYFDLCPDVVSAGGFNPSHDLNANRIQDLSNVARMSENLFFAILPTKNGFWASFLWPTKYQLINRFVLDFGTMATAGAAYAVALAYIENTFLRPSMWQSLSSDEKAAVKNLGWMGVVDDDYRALPKAIRLLSAKYSTKALKILESNR